MMTKTEFQSEVLRPNVFGSRCYEFLCACPWNSPTGLATNSFQSEMTCSCQCSLWNVQLADQNCPLGLSLISQVSYPPDSDPRVDAPLRFRRLFFLALRHSDQSSQPGLRLLCGST